MKKPRAIGSPQTSTHTSGLLNESARRCSCWDDFKQQFAGLSKKQKGDLFEELVKAYLLLDPEYATKLSHVWLHREVPSSIRDRLNLPDADKGIDLIAQTKEGEFWAIQCKYLDDSDQSLSWRKISTFTGLAFGVCRNISFGLICSTTERITHVLKTQDRIGFCALDVWQSLDEEFFDRLRAALGHKPVRIKPLKPRRHQAVAIRDAYDHFVRKNERRGKLIMPCGAGKSLAAYWVARKLGARRILIAVPSLALIRQTLKVWLRESMANGQDVEWICACSDESAGRIERDDVAVLKQDLGVPCLTDPKEIADWFGNTKSNRGLTVVFTTYQSGEAIAKAARRMNIRFDLGIMDEAHKTVGAKDKLFSHLLYDKNLPIRRRIFMTATERRYQGESEQILSMDDPDVYGDTFHLLTFKRALEYKPPILSDYKIVTILVSRDEVAELIRKNVFVRPDKGRWDKEIEAEMLAALVALRKAMKKHPIHHAVSFHSSIRRAEVFKAHNDAFTRSFRSYGRISTFHVSGQTPTGTRARIVKEFAETERGLITNARCLNEGVDVPDIDCVMFADPRRSAVDIVQAVGRALRPAVGKKMGYVIVPILHDEDAKPEDIFESEDFQEILTTLRALAANDDRIIEYFRAISRGKRHTGGGSVEFDLDERLAKRIDLAQFARDIDLKCWDRLAKLSWRPFDEARAFIRKLKLRSVAEWTFFIQGQSPRMGRIPSDIPTHPDRVYYGKGWKGMGDWLGTGTIATHLRAYRPFTKARAFARNLGLRNGNEWHNFTQDNLPESTCRLPSDIPARPSVVYADKGWQGMGDWLGTGNISNRLRKFLPFIEARAFARRLKLKSSAEWQAYSKGDLPQKGRLPADIPSTPNETYADKGWKGYGDWLGTGRVADHLKAYRPFREARTFAQGLHLKNCKQWYAFCRGHIQGLGRLPVDIPASPDQTYADEGWKSWGDWLGSGNVSNLRRTFRPFREARAFVCKLKLRNLTEWRAYCKGDLPQMGRRPADIPTHPDQTYSDSGWQGYGDWLGTGVIGRIGRAYRSFREAQTFARKLRLKSGTEWSAFCKGEMPHKGRLPADIPASPARIYAHKGWKGMGDWLGTGMIAPSLKVYRPFHQARAFARRLKLKGLAEWRAYIKGDLPQKGHLPADIPAYPNGTYANRGWKGCVDWLGPDNIRRTRKIYRPFYEARAFARSLKLRNSYEWMDFCKGQMPEKGRLPPDIPTNPNRTYVQNGWKGMGDWLGTGSISNRLKKFRPFSEARAFARKLKLRSLTQWLAFSNAKMLHKGRRPADIPAAPHRAYSGKGWKGYGDWLGTGRTLRTKR